MNQTSTALPVDQPVVTGNTYPVVASAVDEPAARRFLASVQERLDRGQRIALAVREYEERVASNQPYDDVVNAEEFRARYGA